MPSFKWNLCKLQGNYMIHSANHEITMKGFLLLFSY